MTYSKEKLKTNGGIASPLFQTIRKRKCIRQMLSYT